MKPLNDVILWLNDMKKTGKILGGLTWALKELRLAQSEVVQLEAEVEATNAALEINDNCISGVEDALEKCEAENERLQKHRPGCWCCCHVEAIRGES